MAPEFKIIVFLFFSFFPSFFFRFSCYSLFIKDDPGIGFLGADPCNTCLPLAWCRLSFLHRERACGIAILNFHRLSRHSDLRCLVLHRDRAAMCPSQNHDLIYHFHHTKGMLKTLKIFIKWTILFFLVFQLERKRLDMKMGFIY